MEFTKLATLAKLWTRTKLQTLNGWYESRTWPRFVAPTLQALPGAVFAWASYDLRLHDWISKNPLALPAFVGVGFLAIVVREGMSWAGREEDLDNKNMSVLVSCIDQIVGEKVKRFATTLKMVTGKPLSLGETFETITQPDRQIDFIVDRVWQFFNHFKGEGRVQIRVVLAAMDERHIREFVVFCPSDHPPRSTVEELRDDSATFSQALAAKRLLVIEDVREEGGAQGGRFKPTREAEGAESGSMLCYPVQCHITHRTPYVLSVYANKPRHFVKSKRQAYEYILELFAKRLVLENSLRKIREAAQR